MVSPIKAFKVFLIIFSFQILRIQPLIKSNIVSHLFSQPSFQPLFNDQSLVI